MATKSVRLPREHLLRGLRRLGPDRLRDELENLGTYSGDVPIKRLGSSEIAELLVDGLRDDAILRLTAEGLSRQRSPSVGGPSWVHSDLPSFGADEARKAVPRLKGACAKEWQDVRVEFAVPQLLEGIVYVNYTAVSVQPTIEGKPVLVPSRNTAMILLDYQDKVSTVSARGDEDAMLIGTAWAQALGTESAPVELTLTPSVKHAKLSPRAIAMLEAVYGRIATVGTVINVDRIRTKRQDPASPVQEQTAKGEANHVLVDDDVRRCLRRGDHITALAFQLDWAYGDSVKPRHYVAHVTVTSEAGPLIIRVTRAGHEFERASALYQAIRRAVARPTNATFLAGVRQVISEVG